MFKLIINGNLVRKPEGRTLPSGVNVADFTVAVNHYKEGEKCTEFVRCTAWRNVADKVVRYLDKGSQVICWGKPSVHAWNAREDNAARAQIELSCDEVEFAGKPRGSAEPAAPAEPVTEMQEIDDEGVPFC